MRPDYVVDVGNTRIKWGRCSTSDIESTAAMSHAPHAWSAASFPTGVRWVVTGVVPTTIDQFREWAQARGDFVTVINSWKQVPIANDLLVPDSVGLDRLFGALAARSRFPGQSLIVADAGTALTINFVDATGTFRGGAILAGLGLMARSLHEHTAKLPLIEVAGSTVFPARDTESAIRAGIFAAAVGAIERSSRQCSVERIVFTGGDGLALANETDWPIKSHDSRLTLEGIRIAAEALP